VLSLLIPLGGTQVTADPGRRYSHAAPRFVFLRAWGYSGARNSPIVRQTHGGCDRAPLETV